MDKSKIKKINSVSRSFCAAKWKQVTIDLFNAQTHSCHHPIRHDIPLEEIEKNPSALHNTEYKKSQREQMLKGERPHACDYCWNIENTDKDLISDRYIKSSSEWAFPHIDEIAKADPYDNTVPSYVEIMFDNTCNFACSYCMSTISSSIYNEIKKFGPMDVSDMPDRTHRDNQFAYRTINREKYVEAFWKWFPTISSQLDTFRVTGGEPMLTPNTKKVLEHLNENPNPNLTFAINTNLGVNEKTFQDHIKILKELVTSKKIKHLQIFTSFDAVGEKANYIRPGMDVDLVIKRIKEINKEIPEAFIIIMSTFSILSISSLYGLVKTSIDIKKEGVPLKLDVSYLKEPRYLKANLVDKELFDIFDEQYKKVESEFFNTDFLTSEESEKIKRIYVWVKTTFNSNNNENKIKKLDFVRFIEDFDNRKNFNFLKTFSEFENYFKKQKKVIRLLKSNDG